MLVSSNVTSKISLSLSGGGFRATLFHLGVVAAFRQLGRLAEIEVISCVSGGSIIGAHLVLNWDLYTDPDNEIFEQVAGELVAITTADVRGQIIRRLPLGRHRRFEHCLDQFLYSKALLTGIEDDKRPILVLNTTDLKHGTAAAFIGGRFLPDVRKPKLLDGTSTAIDVGPFSLAQAVACSAAFPALFPERNLSAKDFAQPRKKWEAGASLADGGVYDNLGIQYFLGSTEKTVPTDFYVSDAGAPFDYTAGLSGNVFTRAVRVTNVQMDLLRSSFIEDARETPVPVRLISISDEPFSRQEHGRENLLKGIPPREIVRRLQLIRTDLDKFTDLEIDLLIRHGYTVAYKSLTGSLAATAKVTTVWSITDFGEPPTPAKIQEHSTELERSQKRRLGLFNPKDRLFPLPWFLMCFALLFVVASIKILRPFIFESIRSPIIDKVATGRPYRLTRVMRYVVLEPGAEKEGHRGVLASSRFFYWTRLNQNVMPTDSTFTELLIPTYERSSSVHGLGVIGANAIRESEGTLPFDDRQELTFRGTRGDTLLLGTGIQYEFDWPGPTRNLENITFDNDEDYWAYENTADYIDKLFIIVESRSDRLLVTPPLDCAVLYRANEKPERRACTKGENNGMIRHGLSLYGGALVAEFSDLKPGDEAIIKYKLAWR
jgi:predicted acylesterase/phospholipase RssA